MLPDIVRAYDALERTERRAAPLTVTSARPLPQTALAALAARLGRLYGTTFDVTPLVDPALIGGIRLTMGDKRIDGTIAGRLDHLARLLSTN